MAPSIIVKPISENTVILVLSSGIAVQVSDVFPLGGEIQVAESEQKLRVAKFHRITASHPGTNWNPTDKFKVVITTGRE